MKFRIAVDDFKLNGFELISPLKGDNPLKLNNYIDDGEAEEIICENILEYVPTENLIPFIRGMSAKLQHGGTLTFVGQDLMMLAESYVRGEINVISLNSILFGQKNHAWAFKTSAITLGDINEICEQLGLKVLERKLKDAEFVIKVQRV